MDKSLIIEVFINKFNLLCELEIKPMPRETDFTGYDSASITFLNLQKQGTKATYKAYFKLFLDYANMNGQQILDSRKLDRNLEWETKVLQFKQWMKAFAKLSENEELIKEIQNLVRKNIKNNP